jgi:hypothetical protein
MAWVLRDGNCLGPAETRGQGAPDPRPRELSWVEKGRRSPRSGAPTRLNESLSTAAILVRHFAHLHGLALPAGVEVFRGPRNCLLRSEFGCRVPHLRATLPGSNLTTLVRKESAARRRATSATSLRFHPAPTTSGDEHRGATRPRAPVSNLATNNPKSNPVTITGTQLTSSRKAIGRRSPRSKSPIAARDVLTIRRVGAPDLGERRFFSPPESSRRRGPGAPCPRVSAGRGNCRLEAPKPSTKAEDCLRGQGAPGPRLATLAAHPSGAPTRRVTLTADPHSATTAGGLPATIVATRAQRAAESKRRDERPVAS